MILIGLTCVTTRTVRPPYRSIVRSLAIGVVLSVVSWYGFYSGLGLAIPAGVLDGVL